MTGRAVTWSPPRLPVAGGSAFPARHVWCVGRNYAEHALEMGADPQAEPPVYFSKPASALTSSTLIVYPEQTESLHHEVELVVVLGGGGRHLSSAEADALVFGYAVGLDLTRRDVQARAKQAGHPWEMSKGFDQSAPMGTILPSTRWLPAPDAVIELAVNGRSRQRAQLGEMIWPVPELIARLSAHVTLNPGDVLFAGTPAGVGPVSPGDRIHARIAGLPELALQIVPSRTHD